MMHMCMQKTVISMYYYYLGQLERWSSTGNKKVKQKTYVFREERITNFTLVKIEIS